MKDYLIKAVAYDGYIRAYAIDSTNTVEEARRRHDTWATASAAMGRTLTITAMMGAMLKGDDRLTVKVEGDGPIGALLMGMLTAKSVAMYPIRMLILS